MIRLTVPFLKKLKEFVIKQLFCELTYPFQHGLSVTPDNDKFFI